jgi:hypothetical protein
LSMKNESNIKLTYSISWSSRYKNWF